MSDRVISVRPMGNECTRDQPKRMDGTASRLVKKERIATYLTIVKEVEWKRRDKTKREARKGSKRSPFLMEIDI